ncbi:MAG: hypothetical protein U1A72_16040 [Sulfuritalea sp.]|nr:hypothetical protein [Sulfuritalea sp.]
MNRDPGRNPATGRTDAVLVLTLAYLALPSLIFVFGWFLPPVALVLCAAMIHILVKTAGAKPLAWDAGYSRQAVLLILATSLAWAAFGGGSHFVYANSDWVVRDAVLGDLVFAKWPVNYVTAEGVNLILRSAIGYFLPPALFGKVFGVAHLDLAIYLWTAAGVMIFLLLLPLPGQAGWRLASGLLLVVFFSGMDFVGQTISTESLPEFPQRLEWWVPLSYPSLTGQLLWAPNHCLPIWIGAALIFRHWNTRDLPGLSAAMLPLTLIWTPFAAIGLAPFALLGTIVSVRNFGWRNMPWSSLVSVAIFCLPIGLFLLLDLGGIDSRVASTPTSGPVNYPLQAATPSAYFLFVTCEFLFLALVLAPHVRQLREAFAVAVFLLLALPMIRFGPSNDFLLRLCAPPLVVLLVVCLQTLLTQTRSLFRSSLWIAGLFLVIGGHTAFNELWRAASYRRWPADYQVTLADRQDGRPAAHYAGRLGSSPIRQLLMPLPEPRRSVSSRPPGT